LALGADAPATKLRLLTSVSAWYVGDILRGVPPPTPFAQIPGEAPRAIAFKTGTSYGFRDAWAIGYSARYTVGVWLGRPDGTPRPGQYGIASAAPILFKLFGLLPDEDGGPGRPPLGTVATARTRSLPLGLRHFSLGGKENDVGREPGSSPLRILFPPSDAVLEVTVERGQPNAIPLKAAGGKPPLNWLVDGKPVLAADTRGGVASFIPDGPGFSSVVVIDADGRTVETDVRLRYAE